MASISGPFSYFRNPLFQAPSPVSTTPSENNTLSALSPRAPSSAIPLAAARGKTKKFIKESSQVLNVLMSGSAPIGAGGKALQLTDAVGGLALGVVEFTSQQPLPPGMQWGDVGVGITLALTTIPQLVTKTALIAQYKTVFQKAEKAVYDRIDTLVKTEDTLRITTDPAARTTLMRHIAFLRKRLKEDEDVVRGVKEFRCRLVTIGNDLLSLASGGVKLAGTVCSLTETLAPALSVVGPALGIAGGAFSTIVGAVVTGKAIKECIDTSKKLKEVRAQQTKAEMLPSDCENVEGAKKCHLLQKTLLARQEKTVAMERRKKILKICKGALAIVAGLLAISAAIVTIAATGGLALFPLIGITAAIILVGVGSGVLSKLMKNLTKKQTKVWEEGLPPGIKSLEDLDGLAGELEQMDGSQRFSLLRFLSIDPSLTHKNDLLSALIGHFGELFTKQKGAEEKHIFFKFGIQAPTTREHLQEDLGTIDRSQREQLCKLLGLPKALSSKSENDIAAAIEKKFPFLFETQPPPGSLAATPLHAQ